MKHSTTLFQQGDSINATHDILPDFVAGHPRDLLPSIEKQRAFIRQRPKDKSDYIVEIKPGANVLNLEVFSK